MCHGRIAPKSTAASAVASVGHGVFLPLVILSTLLGDGLASGESQPVFCLWEGKHAIPLFLQKAGMGILCGAVTGRTGSGGFCAVV